MSLDLDERRLAMLREMGLPMLAPPRAEPAPAPAARAAQAPRPRADPAPAAEPSRAAMPAAGAETASAGIAPADWLVLADAPDGADEGPETPFAGLEGQLLGNMLRAVGAGSRANVLRCVPDAGPLLRRQVASARPKVIFAIGRAITRALLGTDEPPGRLRGRVLDFEGIPVVVSYPPAYLLRSPADKARAWADLCLALHVVGQAGNSPAGE